MNRFTALTKSCKYENNTPPQRILQSPKSTVDNGSITKNGSDSIKIMKLEPLPSQQLKRRRSRSHNLMDYYTEDRNPLPFTCHNDAQSGDSTQLLSRTRTYSTNYQMIKEKHKKETHNLVERKRRDFINGQIQKLAELLPSEFFLNYDLKMNKGVILKNSVEYISSLKCVEEINKQLIHESELGSKLIRILVALNDLNCEELSINDDENDAQSTKEIDVNELIKEWHSVRQDNKDLLKQFSQRLFNTINESKKEMSFDNISTLDISNNNSLLISPPSRKRYSSMPTTSINDSNISKKSPSINIIDKNSPILNSLLKRPDVYHQPINDTISSTFNLAKIDDSINYYLQCTNTEPNMPNSNTEESFFQVEDKMYYILPKSNADDQPMNGHGNNSHDPMLISVNFDRVDH